MSFAEKAVDKTIPIPLYYQLKQHLREYITGRKVGDPIPTESELCEHFEVSRPTVRQAIAELVTEGYLTRSKGKGTFVTKPKVQRDFILVLRSFNQEMLERGIIPSTRVLDLSKTVADESVATKLQIETGSDVIFMRRLRSTDQQPLMIVNSFLPCAMVPDFEKYDLEHESLHVLLTDSYGYTLSRAERTVEAIGAPEPEARLLEIDPGSPVQFIDTVVYADNDVPIESSTAWYRGDSSRFTFELRSPKPGTL